jgi:3-oxoacyl-[acyl-carrier-protein] synthase-3
MRTWEDAVLWQDIYIAGTGAWIPPIRRRTSQDTRTPHGTKRPSSAEANGFSSAATSTGDTAAQMAARAALLALSQAGVPSSELSLLVHATFQDADHYTPAAYLLRVLGSARTTGFEIGAASDGGAAGLVAGAEHLSARPGAKAAMITAGSRFVGERWNQVQEIGYVTGDAGAAAVLTRKPGLARLVATAQASAPQLEMLTRVGESVTDIQSGQRLVVESIGLGPHIESLQRFTRACIEAVLEESSLTPADIARTVVIAIGSAVIEMVLPGSPLGSRASGTSWTFGRHIAHAGPCDILLALDWLLRQDSLRPGDRVLIVSFGLGFRWTTAVIEITPDTSKERS